MNSLSNSVILIPSAEAPVAEAALKNLGKVSNYLKRKVAGFSHYEYQSDKGYVWNGVEWVWGNNEMTNDIFEEGNKVIALV